MNTVWLAHLFIVEFKKKKQKNNIFVIIMDRYRCVVIFSVTKKFIFAIS